MASTSTPARSPGADKPGAGKRVATAAAPEAPEPKRRKVEVGGHTREERLEVIDLTVDDEDDEDEEKKEKKEAVADPEVLAKLTMTPEQHRSCMEIIRKGELAFKAILEGKPAPKDSAVGLGWLAYLNAQLGALFLLSTHNQNHNTQLYATSYQLHIASSHRVLIMFSNNKIMSSNNKMMSSNNNIKSSNSKTESLVKPFVQGFETIDDPFSTSPGAHQGRGGGGGRQGHQQPSLSRRHDRQEKDDLTTLQNDLKRIVKILDDTAETAPEYQHVLNQACDCQDLLTETENDLEFLWRKYTSIALGANKVPAMTTTTSSSSAPAAANPGEPIPLPAALRAQTRREFEEHMKRDNRPVTVMTSAGLVTLSFTEVEGNDAGRPQCLKPGCANNQYQGYLNGKSRNSHISHVHDGDWWQLHDGKSEGNDYYHVL
ncbi:unnamed protein product [Aureobasidium pullulans]|nr:unnamed protein product [Aureobasidium pullulans]